MWYTSKRKWNSRNNYLKEDTQGIFVVSHIHRIHILAINDLKKEHIKWQKEEET